MRFSAVLLALFAFSSLSFAADSDNHKPTRYIPDQDCLSIETNREWLNKFTVHYVGDLSCTEEEFGSFRRHVCRIPTNIEQPRKTQSLCVKTNHFFTTFWPNIKIPQPESEKITNEPRSLAFAAYGPWVDIQPDVGIQSMPTDPQASYKLVQRGLDLVAFELGKRNVECEAEGIRSMLKNLKDDGRSGNIADFKIYRE